MSGIKKKIKTIPILGSVLYRVYMINQSIQRHRYNVRTVNALKWSDSPCLFYFDIPIHPNLGDNAQYFCIKTWLKDNFPDYQCVEIDGLTLSDIKCGIIDKLKAIIKKDDIIFFQSGYCTQDLGGYHNLIHKIIITNFPGHPIIMLPQTVYFRDNKEAQLVSRIYEQHGNIFFMARDYTSETIAKKLFPSLSVTAYPDIVTSLIGTRISVPENRYGIVLCIRNDSEKFYSNEELDQLQNKLSRNFKVSICDTTVDISKGDFRMQMQKKINDLIDRFQKAKVVITDRYHGTIFSLIAGTPVIVIKTTDHKVKTGVDWFKGVYDEYVCYCDTLDDAEKQAIKFYNGNYSYRLDPYFKEKYYDCLKEKIDQWLLRGK